MSIGDGSLVSEAADFGAAGLVLDSAAFEGAAPAEIPTDFATPPQRAFGHARQTRLTAELLGTLGTSNGAVRPRYRRGVNS